MEKVHFPPSLDRNQSQIVDEQQQISSVLTMTHDDGWNDVGNVIERNE